MRRSPFDTPPSSLKNSNASLKEKTTKEERIGVHFLIRNILKVKRACWSSGMGIRMNDKQVNYSYGF